MFKDVLKRLRTAHGYTQAELGKILKVSHSAIGMYEAGNRMPDYEMMKSISNLFNVSMDYLYEREVDTGLTETESLLLELFRQIPEDQQKVFLEMGRVYANSLKKD